MSTPVLSAFLTEVAQGQTQTLVVGGTNLGSIQNNQIKVFSVFRNNGVSQRLAWTGVQKDPRSTATKLVIRGVPPRQSAALGQASPQSAGGQAPPTPPKSAPAPLPGPGLGQIEVTVTTTPTQSLTTDAEFS